MNVGEGRCGLLESTIPVFLPGGGALRKTTKTLRIIGVPRGIQIGKIMLKLSLYLIKYHAVKMYG
jgi:hypothetical protein